MMTESQAHILVEVSISFGWGLKERQAEEGFIAYHPDMEDSTDRRDLLVRASLLLDAQLKESDVDWMLASESLGLELAYASLLDRDTAILPVAAYVAEAIDIS